MTHAAPPAPDPLDPVSPTAPTAPTAPGPAATRRYTQHIAAAPERVFPLLCPVREAEWLDGWTYDLLRSTSGFAEEGCVFRTTAPGEPETVWIVTRHDAGEGRVEFARVTAGLLATRLCVRVEADGGGRSLVHVTYEFTPTSPQGARVVAEHHSEEAFRRSLEWWERSMNEFLTTGRILRRRDG